MLPPEVTSIASLLLGRFHDVVAADVDRILIPEVLAAEEMILIFIRELGCSMLQEFVDVRVEQALLLRPPCACGRRMEVLRRRSPPRTTLLGPINVGDPYTYCRYCHENGRPARAALGTEPEKWSLPTQEAAVDLAADESCAKAVAKLSRHHPGVEMDRTTALRMIHEHGGRARLFIDEKLGAAVAASEQGMSAASPAKELEVEYDASMIPVATFSTAPTPPGEQPKLTPIRKIPVRKKDARWEEVKAGLVQRPGENDRLYALRPTGGLLESFGDLIGLASLMGWTPETEVRGLADGAVHIRQRMEEAFGDGNFRFILDRPHCKEHLGKAGEALARHTRVDAQEWAQGALDRLERGRVAEVVAELEKAYLESGPDAASRDDALRLAAGYFERNRDAVAYAEYRERGWGTASSEIESGHRQTVQARMKIAGAWWHPDGVDDILALRMLKANGWWDEYWQRQREQWREHAGSLATKPSLAA